MTTPLDLARPRAREVLLEALTSDPVRLDEAALAICLLERPMLDLAAVDLRLDGLADRVAALVGPGSAPISQLQALQRVLAHEEGLSGNREEPSAPEHSFLDLALEHKHGLPITLSVIYLEVARRAGVPLYGVGFPGHFLVALDAGDRRLVVDPFHEGQILTEQGCAELLKTVAPQLKFSPRMITPTAPRAILFRMLGNLKRAYLERTSGEQALRVVDLMLAISPDHPGELRARAGIFSALGAYRAALADVERCLELSPGAPDHQSLMLTANALRQRVSVLN